jgi:hypothetical protein
VVEGEQHRVVPLHALRRKVGHEELVWLGECSVMPSQVAARAAGSGSAPERRPAVGRGVACGEVSRAGSGPGRQWHILRRCEMSWIGRGKQCHVASYRFLLTRGGPYCTVARLDMRRNGLDFGAGMLCGVVGCGGMWCCGIAKWCGE